MNLLTIDFSHELCPTLAEPRGIRPRRSSPRGLPHLELADCDLFRADRCLSHPEIHEEDAERWDGLS